MPHLTITKVTETVQIVKSTAYYTVGDCWTAARAFQQDIDYGRRPASYDVDRLLDKGILIGRQDAGVAGVSYVGPNAEYKIEVTA